MRSIKVSSATCECLGKRQVTLVHAPLVDTGYSIMHIKLMLLLYRSKLRVIISSFDLDEDCQWGVMTDVFWAQDFALLQSVEDKHVPPLRDSQSSFFDRLLDVIPALGCDDWNKLLGSLHLDISDLYPNTHLIATVPSQHQPRGPKDRQLWCGMPYLRQTLENNTPAAPLELSPVL